MRRTRYRFRCLWPGGRRYRRASRPARDRCGKSPPAGRHQRLVGGWLWVPRNPLAVAEGIVENDDAPERYLRAQTHTHELDPRQRAFLRYGPEMVAFFQQHTAVQFQSGSRMPDMREGDGSANGGRSLCALPYDGRLLGPWLHKLRPPLDIVSLAGMGIAGGADMAAFFNATHSPKAALHVGKRLLRHGRDLLLHRRGQQLVNGNALVARLLRSALDLGVTLLTDKPASRLLGKAGSAARCLPMARRFKHAGVWCWPVAASRTTASASLN